MQSFEGQSLNYLFLAVEGAVRVTTKIVWDIETGTVLHHDFFEYEGPVIRGCGGPSSQQSAAATSQANLSNAELAEFQKNSAQTDPFYANVLANGIPGMAQQQQYSTSDLAGQINQAKANEKTKLAGFGSALPSGFAEQESADIGAKGAQAFDQNQLSLLSQQFAAKMAAAQGLNPQASASGASGANQSILQAPLQNSFWSNLISGLIQGGSKVAAAAV
jgi:hypothetical protein